VKIIRGWMGPGGGGGREEIGERERECMQIRDKSWLGSMRTEKKKKRKKKEKIANSSHIISDYIFQEHYCIRMHKLEGLPLEVGFFLFFLFPFLTFFYRGEGRAREKRAS
jgi:hypothetical protein